MNHNQLIIYTDGGSRGNPGDAAIGVVAVFGDKTEFEKSTYLGQLTNNEAEYCGFIESVKLLINHEFTQKPESVLWRLDSMLVVQQLNKNWKIKEKRLQKLANEAWDLLDRLPYSFTITHVPRSENKQADLLVNQALDAAQL